MNINFMIEILKLGFILGLFYCLFLTIKVVIVGGKYDKAKRKIDKNYKANHSFSFISGQAMAQLPWPIEDNDLRLKEYVKNYNKWTKIFWISYLFVIPILIYIGKAINKFN